MNKKKAIFICSSGGHLSEMMKLEPLFNHFDSILVTEKDQTTKQRQFPLKTIFLLHGTRKRIIPYLFKFSFNIIKSLAIYFRYRPDIVITTGAHTAVPMIYIAHFFKKKTIFIESIARVHSKSLAGKLMQKHCSLIIVQWPSMLKVYENAVLGGLIL